MLLNNKYKYTKKQIFFKFIEQITNALNINIKLIQTCCFSAHALCFISKSVIEFR